MYQAARPVKLVLDETRRFGNRVVPGRGRLPDFIIIGAQKAATTSLYNYLLQNPAVVPAVTKEVHFFDHRYARGTAWYRSNFPLPAGGRASLCGEASPYYLFHPEVPERIRKTCSGARLIALLRDPVKRAISHYQHEFRRGFERLPLREALEAEESRLAGERERLADPRARSYNYEHYSYLARGRYAEQLERWLNVFPRGQLLVLESERLSAEPQAVLERVAGFLGIDRWQPDLEARHNRGAYQRPDADVVAFLEEYFAEPNRALVRLLGQEFSWAGAASRRGGS